MDDMQKDRIETNYTIIKENIDRVKEDFDIDNDINLVAVTKYVDSAHIKVLCDLGIKAIGESRIKDAKSKFSELDKMNPEILKNVKKHLIGHLQSNKTKEAVEVFDVIETIDSLKLARKISAHALEMDKCMDVMIQVNIGREDQKYGIDPEKTEEFYNEIKDFENINIIGLMCIAPKISEDVDDKELREFFLEMKALKEKLGLKELSMGMSGDFELAIECGSTNVRIGSKCFN